MKTTVEIPNTLLAEARKVASREGTTLKALIQDGLRRVLAERKRPMRFRLRDVSFKGQGLQPEFADASWEQIRDAIYEGHGS